MELRLVFAPSSSSHFPSLNLTTSPTVIKLHSAILWCQALGCPGHRMSLPCPARQCRDLCHDSCPQAQFPTQHIHLTGLQGFLFGLNTAFPAMPVSAQGPAFVGWAAQTQLPLVNPSGLLLHWPCEAQWLKTTKPDFEVYQLGHSSVIKKDRNFTSPSSSACLNAFYLCHKYFWNTTASRFPSLLLAREYKVILRVTSFLIKIIFNLTMHGQAARANFHTFFPD